MFLENNKVALWENVVHMFWIGMTYLTINTHRSEVWYKHLGLIFWEYLIFVFSKSLCGIKLFLLYLLFFHFPWGKNKCLKKYFKGIWLNFLSAVFQQFLGQIFVKKGNVSEYVQHRITPSPPKKTRKVDIHE